MRPMLEIKSLQQLMAIIILLVLDFYQILLVFFFIILCKCNFQYPNSPFSRLNRNSNSLCNNNLIFNKKKMNLNQKLKRQYKNLFYSKKIQLNLKKTYMQLFFLYKIVNLFILLQKIFLGFRIKILLFYKNFNLNLLHFMMQNFLFLH